MNDQDRAAQVWKGPWKCEKCGEGGSDYWRQIVNEHGYHVLNENENCTGRIVPYDRRNPSQAAYGQEQFRAGVEALRNDLKQWAKESSITGLLSTVDIIMRTDKLLAEQEEKK